MPELRIGTSGWAYEHWRGGIWYPADVKRGEELEYYARHFDSVEVNSSFYHVPRETTFRTWAQKTPGRFLFALKASRYITHRLKLKDAAEPLGLVMSRASLLGHKLGPVLFQLSPSYQLDLDRLGEFTALLPRDKRFTFEFRHPSWFCDETYALLSSRNVALTIADTPEYPCAERMTADFVYVRLHGHEALYASNYSPEQLSEWAGKVRTWLGDGRDAYVYFDNDACAFAPRNALQLRRLATEVG
jgi:uncharacterized protein YecE (DUF72 family)